MLPIVARRQFSMPRLAPHFVDALLADRVSPGGRIDTTIDAGLQRLVERHVERHLNRVGDVGMRNAASLLVDTRDMSVKAWVGSADYWNEAIDGQVNGVLAKRSPGSTLKPFVYALALDQGVLHPQTMLRDAPTSFGPFTPENFDGRFFGPISAEEALIRSRNVPAVWVSTQLKQPSLYQFLQSAGVRDMKPESFYGLALRARRRRSHDGGARRPLRDARQPGRAASAARRGIGEPPACAGPRACDCSARKRASSRSTCCAAIRGPTTTARSRCARDGRSRGRPARRGDSAMPGPPASSGRTCSWSGSATSKGQGNPAFVGVDAAAPLFFRIADALNLARPGEAAEPLTPPPGVSRVAVCAGSGDLPNADCPHTVDTWYIPGKSPIRVSQLHRAVAIDPLTGRPGCPPYAAGTRFEVFEFWSSDMLKLFRQAGMPRRIPPPLPPCTAEDTMDGPRIASPLRSVSYALRRSAPQEAIALDASAAADVQRVFWFDGSALIGVRAVADGALPWRPAAEGAHLIRIVDDHGRSAERDVEVRFTQ